MAHSAWLFTSLLFASVYCDSDSPLFVALGAKGTDKSTEVLSEFRKLRNSRAVLQDQERLFSVTSIVEEAMKKAYYEEDALEAACEGKRSGDCKRKRSTVLRKDAPGNFHGVKSHSYYVSAISEAHPTLPYDAVQSIVASEWYHPGLTAKSVWCDEGCGAEFPLAKQLDENFHAIQAEVQAFWEHPDALGQLKGVGSHTTQFDQMIAGNGTWVDVRLWRGRAFNKYLCERHFRTICSIVEASPEIWTNPWGHVLLSILLPGSWVPFHQGHTNGQLTYHFPVNLPASGGYAELAVSDKGGTLPEETSSRGKVYQMPDEHTVRWKKGKTLVFDDSFTHSVRFRTDSMAGKDFGAGAEDVLREASVATLPTLLADARVVLLMRGWHPELRSEERAAVRDFVRKGGEEQPDGYDMLPISAGIFTLGS